MTKKEKLAKDSLYKRIALLKNKAAIKERASGTGLIQKLDFSNLILLCITINIVLIFSIFLLKNLLPPQLPLLYGLPEGEEQLVKSTFLIIPSVVCLLLIIINSGLSLILKNDFLKKTLSLTSIAITFLSLVTTLKIIFLVWSL